MTSNKLGIGMISDRLNGKDRVIVLSIQRLGIITIQVVKGEIIYPKGKRITKILMLRIIDYIF
jgi:hypothetical protein